MGFTHYHEHKRSLQRAAWTGICEDARKLINASPVKLALRAANPAQEPMIRDGKDGLIVFNGIGEEGYEDFYLSRRDTDCWRTKTGFEAGRPYDLVVCAVLACVDDRNASAMRIWSDGNRDHWQKPVEWASSVLGRTLPIPGLVEPTGHSVLP